MSEPRILIVEDEVLLSLDLNDRLSEWGYQVVGEARSGAEAVSLALETRPDLVLIDITLDGELDGIEATTLIRSRLNTAIIYLSAHSEDRVFDRAMLTDPDGYLCKPISLLELRRTVEMAIYKHRMEKRLRESEERLRSIIESMDDLLFVLDETGVFVDSYQSADAVRSLYVPPKDFLGKHFRDVLPADVSGLLDQALERLAATGKSQEFDYPMTVAGERQWYSARISTLRGGDGQAKGVTVVARLISDRKRMEEALRLSEERYRLLVETIPYGIQETDNTGIITFANEAQSRMQGYARDEIAGKHIWDFMQDAARSTALRECFKTVLKEQPQPKPYHWLFATKHGDTREIQIDWNYKVDDYGNVAGFVSVMTDITDRKRAQENLRRTKETFEAIFNGSTDFMFLVDAGGLLRLVNSAVAERLGKPAGEVLGKKLVDVLPPELATPMQAHVDRVVKSGQCLRFETVISGMALDMICFPVGDPDGHIDLVATVARDITELTRLQTEISRLATTDSLTNTFTPAHFIELAAGEVSRAKRYGSALTLMMIDIDGFKSIADTHGSSVGDSVLCEFSDLSRNNLRRVDLIGRIGDHEFGVILPETNPAQAKTVARRLRKIAANMVLCTASEEVHITLSIGVAGISEDEQTRESLFSHAEAALKSAGERGGDVVEIYGEPGGSHDHPHERMKHG